MTPSVPLRDVKKLVQSIRVLIVDDNQYQRNVIRMLLMNIGVKKLYEAGDGMAALDTIRTVAPDLVILDWEMPFLSGPELVRVVRQPGVFPIPDVPIIMLSAHCERWRVVEAARLGINEFLTKPISSAALLERIVANLANPRASVQLGNYYGPAPRKDLPEPIARPAAPARPVPKSRDEAVVN
jgi:two-component system, chemotaxis family, chemotaxis protein CheY